MKKIFVLFLSGILFFVNFLSVSANNETNKLDEYQQNPAKAQLYFEGTLVGDWGQSTFYLRLYVPHSSGAYCGFSTW